MADEPFKLPQASYETLVRIIKAYAHVGEKTNLGEIADVLGVDPTQVSRNTGFLVAVGLLEGGRDKGATPLAVRLTRAIDFDRTEDVSAAWREALAGQTIVQRTIAAIRVRGGMDASTLQAQIVYTAGAKKDSKSMAGGGAVVEMMKHANLIAERDGQLLAVSSPDTSSPGPAPDDETEVDTAPQTIVQRVIETRRSSGVAVSIDLSIAVTATPEQLPALGDQIRKMLERFDSSQGATEADDNDLS